MMAFSRMKSSTTQIQRLTDKQKKCTHCVLKPPALRAGKGDAPTGALSDPILSKERAQERVQQAGPRSSQLHPAPTISSAMLDTEAAPINCDCQYKHVFCVQTAA